MEKTEDESKAIS